MDINCGFEDTESLLTHDEFEYTRCGLEELFESAPPSESIDGLYHFDDPHSSSHGPVSHQHAFAFTDASNDASTTIRASLEESALYPRTMTTHELDQLGRDGVIETPVQSQHMPATNTNNTSSIFPCAMEQSSPECPESADSEAESMSVDSPAYSEIYEPRVFQAMSVSSSSSSSTTSSRRASSKSNRRAAKPRSPRPSSSRWSEDGDGQEDESVEEQEGGEDDSRDTSRRAGGKMKRPKRQSWASASRGSDGRTDTPKKRNPVPIEPPPRQEFYYLPPIMRGEVLARLKRRGHHEIDFPDILCPCVDSSRDEELDMLMKVHDKRAKKRIEQELSRRGFSTVTIDWVKNARHTLMNTENKHKERQSKSNKAAQ